MKPLFLRLKAFGPFAGQVQVSFDRVLDGGLFLIHGRTGSGKTSLLDGLCFSLFGRPSSEEREKDMRALRSDLASAQTMTETELVFAIGNVAYRVVRVPTQVTPKKRGEGFTEHKGSAELARFEGSLQELRDFLSQAGDLDLVDFSALKWAPLAGKVEAVDDVIEKLLGMNERQFRQVVVLPQGRFREFLSSSSTERQAILEKLFQTDRFSRLQTYVASRARLDEAKFAQASESLFVKMKQFGIEQFDDIEPKKIELQLKVTQTNEARALARQTVDRLSAEFNQSKEFELAKSRHTALTVEHTRLEQRSGAIDQAKRRLSEARTWQPFFQLEDQQIAALRKSIDRKATHAVASSTVRSLSKIQEDSVKRHAVLVAKKPSISELTSERARLREIAIALKEIEGLRKRVDSERATDLITRESIETAKKSITQLELEQNVLLSSLFSIDERLRTSEAADLEREHRTVRELELGFHLSEAARLSATLRPGEPCPVCGSATHPTPATAKAAKEMPLGANGRTISADDIKVAQARLDQHRLHLTESRTKRQSRLDPFVGLLRAATTTPADDTSLDFESNFVHFESVSKRLRETLQSIDVRSAEFAARENSRVNLLDTLEERLNAVPLGDRSLENVMKRGLELKTEQDVREPELKAVELEINRTASELARIQGSTAALEDEIAQLEKENAQRAARLTSLTPKSERPSERLEPRALAHLESEIEAYNEAKNRNLASLHEVDQSLARVQGARSAGLVETELRAATIERNDLEQTAATQQVDLDGVLKLQTEIGTGRVQLATLKDDAERGARMAALLTGDRSQNKMLVPLARFVLQSRFDDVLEQANRRLGRMSRGQFQLRRPALSRNLRDSQGLELSVEDSVAGKERHAGSLSGGESFMAALSLALGLADVVQADLGGVKLDSVLIDEGFGTLDSESLDLAMRTLVDLQDGGRVVGIISHVQELKTQVANQLEVTKTPSGSSLEWRG
ncbi:SMC family ATPase [soil metagenome]